MKVTLSSLDDKKNQISNNIDFIVKVWKQDSIIIVKELYNVCKNCSICTNIVNCMVQCIRDFNGMID